MTTAPISRPLRIVFYRPHTEIWFMDPVQHLMRGVSLPNKYEAFFEFLLNSGAEVSVSTALCRRKGWKGLIRYLLNPLELIYWVLGSKIGLSKIGFIFSKAGLRKHDVLFFMHYGNFTYKDAASAQRGSELALDLSDVDILKLGHFTHYAYQPAIGSNNLEKLGVKLLVAENNMFRNSDIYQKYFGRLIADFWRLLFNGGNRFSDPKNFLKLC